MNQSPLLILLSLVLLLAVMLARFLPLMQPWQYFLPKMTGSATVSSRRVEYRHGWNYYILFSLGSLEMELKVSEQDYHALPEGTEARLIWRDTQLPEYET